MLKMNTSEACRPCNPLLKGALSLVVLLPSLANAASIEDELFGAPDQSTSNSSPPSPPSTSTSTSTSAAAVSTNSLGEAVQKTTIGGRADWSLASTAERLESPGNLQLRNVFSGLVYLDSRPSELVRGYLKLKVSDSSFRLLELWMKWQTDYGVFWTIGKQPIKWGSATLWNPTDFLAAETRDPLAFFDDREGAQALRAHMPLEAQNANLYLVASLPSAQATTNLATSREQRIDDLQLSARAEWAFRTGEIAAAYAFRQGGPTRAGIDFSAGIGALDFDSEVSCTFRSRKKFFKRSLSAAITPEERKQLCLPQAVVGSSWEYQYSDSDSFTLGVEYFWNGLGHNDPTLELVSFLQGGGTPLYLAQQYLGSWLLIPKPASWNNSTVQFNYIKNLTDFSELYRLTYIHEVLTYGRISLGITARNGLGEFRVNRADLEKALEAFDLPEGASEASAQKPSAEVLLKSTPKWQADITFSVTL